MSVSLEQCVSALDVDLVCSGCKCICLDVVQLLPCQHILCLVCHNSSKSSSLSACPRCGIEPIEGATSAPHWLVLKLSLLEVRCSRKCGAIVKLSELRQHESNQCVDKRHNAVVKMQQQRVRDSAQTIIRCSACGMQMMQRNYFKHQVEQGCVHKALARDLARCQRQCHFELRNHNEVLKKEAAKSQQLTRRVHLTHWADRGCKGFERWATSTLENAAVISPISSLSRTAQPERRMQCQKCNKMVLENYDSICSHHAGVS